MTQPPPASSSSTHPSIYRYHVFLSFRGADTRIGFAYNLYNALRRKGIHTFFDDEELQTGDMINPTLIEAIRESRMAIIIFSPKYLESNACLMELTEISNHMSNEFILPIFYNIEPKTLRDESETKKIKEEWRSALKYTTRIKGRSFRTDGTLYEDQIIEEVADQVSKKLDRPSSTIDYHVGLKSRVDEVCLLLNGESNERVSMVGITGIGGIGKTTLARAVYNTLACQYKYLYFLSNVREKSVKVDGLAKLQQKLLSKFFMENSKRHPFELLKNRLRAHKVLLVLDDVDNLQQLKALALKEWFSPGSKIIITTRNKKLLDSHGVGSIYEVKELNEGEARKLLLWLAFGESEVGVEYKGVLNQAVDFAKGHPLLLEALGSNLHGLTAEEWESALEIYARNPSRLQWCDKDIQNILEVSYNGLTEDQKEIFLDIACFYKGVGLDYVKNRLYYSHGFDSKYCISVLIDKLLIKIGQDGCLDMHDLYQEMGKEIVRQPSKLEPGGCSRLWSLEDILHVLENDTGTGEIQVIKLIEYGDKKIEWSGEAFRKMYNLRELCVKGNIVFSTEPKFLPSSLRVLEWHQYPSSSLPSGFKPDNLVLLNLHDSRIELEKPFQRFNSMLELILDHCQYLTQVPELSGAPLLENMNLNHCKGLIKIDDSVGSDLLKLRKLTVRGCHRLKIFPRVLKLPSLEILELVECWSLKTFPEILVSMENIKSVCLSHSRIVELPESIENLFGLEYLYLNGCKRLCEVPMGSIAKLRKLESLIAGSLDYGQLGCCEGQEEKYNDPKLWTHVERLKLDHSNFIDGSLPGILSWFPNLRELDLSFSNFKVLPACIEKCHCLEKLYLNGCYPLQEIEGIPPNIKRFSAANTSLSLNSSLLLLSQELHVAGNTNFILPGNLIPNWFHYNCNSDRGCFWVRQKLPDIIACVVLRVDSNPNMPQQFGFDFEVSINGARGVLLKEEPRYFNFIHFELKRDHIYLVDLTSRIQKLELQLENSKREWNLIELSCPKNSWFSFNSSNHGEIRGMGVYLSNLRSYAEDISLVGPDRPYRNLSNGFMNSVTDSYTCYDEVPWRFWEEHCKDLWDRYISDMWDNLEEDSNSNSNATTSQHAYFRREDRTWYQSINEEEDQEAEEEVPFALKLEPVCLSHGGIVNIPESIKNLTRLTYLNLNGCQKLSKIPMGSSAKLRKLQSLKVGLLDYGQLGHCEGQEENYNGSELCKHVERLKLNHSNFIDGSLPGILSWLPSLRELDLSFSNFKVLPVCIKECHCLKKLDLNGCYALQEIEGIPPNMKRFSAANTSLPLKSSLLLMSQESTTSGPRLTNKRKRQQDSTPINPVIITEGMEEKEEEKGKETIAEEEEAIESNEGSMEKGNLCIIPDVPTNLPSTSILEAVVLQRDSFLMNSEDFNQVNNQEAEEEVSIESKAKVVFPFESKAGGGKEKSPVKVDKSKPKVQKKPTRSKKQKIYEEAETKKKAAMKRKQPENPSSKQPKRKAKKRLAEAGEDYVPKQKTAHLIKEGKATEHQKEDQDQPAAPAVQQASNSPQVDQIDGLSARVTKLESEIVDLKELVHDGHRMVMDQFSHLSKLLYGSALSSQPPNH